MALFLTTKSFLIMTLLLFFIRNTFADRRSDHIRLSFLQKQNQQMPNDIILQQKARSDPALAQRYFNRLYAILQSLFIF